MNRSPIPLCFIIPAMAFATAVATAQDTQRFNLYGASDVPKFPYSQSQVWPDEVGEAKIALWSGDKFAALSITIDDNLAPDHPWWLEMAEKYDLQLTWFVITQRVGTGATWGTWEGFQELVDAGHSVQSHTVTHGDLDYDGEYAPSQEAINNHITGQLAWTIAYPGGTAYPPRPDLAKDFYIGGRGVHGTPNKATSINYLETDSTSGRINSDYLDSVLFGRSGISWMNNTTYLRGWLCTHFHLVQDKPAIEADLQYLDSHREMVWVDSFYDVIRFVQERDTATVNVTAVEWNEIRFDLSDWMDDSIYDFPLTIKIRIPNEWTAVAATQDGQPIDSWMQEHEGNQYVLVDAIPDRGEVILAGEGGVEGDTQAPTAPSGVSVTAIVGDTSATVSWQASTDDTGVVSYVVYIDGEPSMDATGTETVLTDLALFTQYSVTITALDDAGNESAPSEAIQFTILVYPGSVRWGDWPADSSGYANTGAYLGWLYIGYTPWLWSYDTNSWFYAPDPGPAFTGTWIFVQGK